MAELKLIAFDADDLAVISAHLQDAVLKVGDIAYLPRERRFAAVGNRFDWADALTDGKAKTRDYVRRQMALRFERVLGAQLQGIDPKKEGAVLSLLAIAFEPGEAPEDPSGHVTLHFADGAAIRLAGRVHRGRDEGPGAGVARQSHAATSRRRSGASARHVRRPVAAAGRASPCPCT